MKWAFVIHQQTSSTKIYIEPTWIKTNHLTDYEEKPTSRTRGRLSQNAIATYSEDYDNYSYHHPSNSTHSPDPSQTTTMKTVIPSHDEHYHSDRFRTLSVIREGNDLRHENKIGPQWTRLLSVPKLETNTKSSRDHDHAIHQPLMINDNEILIMAQMIKEHEDLMKIPTYLYAYNITTGTYSKFTEYPHDFPKGSHTTTVDRANGIIYIFTEKGYICSYNMNINLPGTDECSTTITPSGSSLSLTSYWQWKWEIIHGVSAWSSHNLRNNTCSVMIDDKLHIISGKQHVVWNKNTKQLELLDRFRIWNYAQMVYIPGQKKILLIGGNDPDNARSGYAVTLDTMFLYSVGVNRWRN